MSLDDTLTAAIAASQQPTDRQDTPAGWSPGIEWDEGAGYGTIVSPPGPAAPDWTALSPARVEWCDYHGRPYEFCQVIDAGSCDPRVRAVGPEVALWTT